MRQPGGNQSLQHFSSEGSAVCHPLSLPFEELLPKTISLAFKTVKSPFPLLEFVLPFITQKHAHTAAASSLPG